VANLEAEIAGMPLAPIAIEQALQARFRLLGPQGLAGIAMAAVDMAAWDALARAVGLPLARLLSGESRPTPIYNSLGMGGVELAAREAEESAVAGFNGVKYKVGYPNVQTDLAVVRGARKAGGEDPVIMDDYNQSLDAPEAVRRGRWLDVLRSASARRKAAIPWSGGSRFAWLDVPAQRSPTIRPLPQPLGISKLGSDGCCAELLCAGRCATSSRFCSRSPCA
jgi:Enolase C-terminal domain-like/Mandelate racemase / muconate lactonizing enzyme, N-terminal domain